MALFPPAPPHNFVVTYSVVLPYSLDRVFSVLGSGSNLEAVARLSAATQDFTLGDTVTIPVPEGGVENSRGNQLSEPVKDGEAGAKRTSFKMTEHFSTLLGLIQSHVRAISFSSCRRRRQPSWHRSISQVARPSPRQGSA